MIAKAVLASITCSLVLLSACSRQAPSPDSAAEAGGSGPAQTELVKVDEAVGTGAPIVAGQTAIVHYTGWLYSAQAPENKGKKFDSSRDRGEPFDFVVGGGRVIKGWDDGVAGMQVGGRRRLIIPSDLGYGPNGARDVIPPNATLLFEVELLGIETPNSVP
jgi:FKBP-type peptidyl-prolyl cis-trans isomerase FkpA